MIVIIDSKTQSLMIQLWKKSNFKEYFPIENEFYFALEKLYHVSYMVCSFKRRITSFNMLFLFFIAFIFQVHTAYSVTTTINSIAAGNWSTAANWSTGIVPDADDFVNINNSMTLNSNLSPASGATYTFYANSSGSGNLNTSNGAIIDIRANVTFSGTGNNLNGGTIYVRSGYTLTLADIATANASTFVIVESGATLIILGNFLDNHGTMTIDGTLTVNGNYDGQAADAIVTGSGSFTTGGYLKGINGSSVFGVVNPNCSGPCSGNNLCTSFTVSVTPTTSALCAIDAQILTATVSSGSPSYQWQFSSTGVAGSFTDILLAVGSSYLPITLGKTYYRVKVTGTSCTKYSNVVSVTYGLAVPTATAITGTTTVCKGSTQTYSTSSLLATDYTWTVPAGSVITSGAGTNTIKVIIGATGGNVTVTPVNGCGSGPVVSKAITVNTLTPGTISTTATAVCQNSTGKVYTISGVTGATGYNWVVPSGATFSGGNTTSITVAFGSSAVSGYVTVTPTNACGSSTTSAAQYVSVGLPSAVGSITGSLNVCKGQSVAYSVSAVSGATSYSYTLPSGVTISSGSGTNSIVASFLGASVASGTFTVNAINSCGSTSNSVTINISSTCAETWAGTISTDWNTTGNWSLGFIPTSTNAITIPSGTPFSPQIAGGSGFMSSITIASGALLTVSSTGTLNAYGNITNSGTVTTVTGSTVAFNAASAQSVTGVPVLHNVVINNTSGGVSLGSAVTVKGTLSLTKGVLTTNSNLTINFDNGGNIAYASGDLGSISGDVSGRRDVSAKTHYLSVPFSGVTSAQVQATTPLFVNPYWKMYTKTFAAQNWAAVTNTTTAMPMGTGYSLSLPAAAPLIFTGTYDHAYTLPGENYSNAAATKYFMLGNPYPSTLDWDNGSGWTKTNVANAIYYWDAPNSRAASYVAGVGTNGATRYIPAMQSVLISTTGSGGSSSVSINNNARLSSQNPSYFRVASVDDIIRLTLTGSDTTYQDEAVIRFNEMATDSFDFDLDAHKILNTGFMPSVYTKSKEEMYSINSFASVDSAQYIPVAAKIVSDGAYTLKIAGNNSNIEYVLVDKLLGTKRSIESDSVYTFSGSKADDVNRFELQLRTAAVTIPTGIQSANKNGGLGIYSSTKGFVIKTDRYAGEEAEIEILDLTGNSIKTLSGKNLSTGSTYVPTDLPDGSYLIKVYVNGNTFAGMIVLVK